MCDDDDDIDDSMAGNPEPHRELGYTTTTEPRRRQPNGAGHWEIVWRDAVDGITPITAAAAIPRKCRMCGELDPSGVLHSLGSDIKRNVCGRCQGQANRGRT